MDRFRQSYKEFFFISKKYLELNARVFVGKEDYLSDLESMLTILPIIEEKTGTIGPESDIVRVMKYFNYKILSFWFLKSDAVVKSVYNKITDDTEKEKFVTVFKNMLMSVKVISSINDMYSNMKKDTNDIIQDFKKVLEIFSLIKNSTSEQQAYKILMDYNSFISKTINKILNDGNYIIKIISLFNADVINNKEKLEEYKDIFSFSKENVIFGIKCFNHINIEGTEQTNNKYVQFFKKLLCNIIIFQNNEIKTHQFIQVFQKIANILYIELRTNENIHSLIRMLMESLRKKISIEDLKRRNVNSIQSVLKEISDNKEFYKNLFVEEYNKHKHAIIQIFQNIIHDYDITYSDKVINVEVVFNFIHTHYIEKL